MALQQQKGAVPFAYDPAKPQDLTIKLNDQASKDVLNYWADLAKRDSSARRISSPPTTSPAW